MNDFYTVEDIVIEGKVLNGKISFNTAHDIFKGHFPGQPIVPGVCMIQIVKEILEQQIVKETRLTKAPQVKFLQLIIPETQPVIYLQWQEEADHLSVNASFKTDRDLFKMNAHFLIRN